MLRGTLLVVFLAIVGRLMAGEFDEYYAFDAVNVDGTGLKPEEFSKKCHKACEGVNGQLPRLLEEKGQGHLRGVLMYLWNQTKWDPKRHEALIPCNALGHFWRITVEEEKGDAAGAELEPTHKVKAVCGHIDQMIEGETYCLCRKPTVDDKLEPAIGDKTKLAVFILLAISFTIVIIVVSTVVLCATLYAAGHESATKTIAKSVMGRTTRKKVKQNPSYYN